MRFAILLAVFVTSINLVYPSYASSTSGLSVADLADKATFVVRGTITEVWTETDENGTVWTYAQLIPARTFKGDPGDVLILEQIGGRYADQVTDIWNAPRFSVGEEGYFFIKKTPRLGRLVIVGMAQGKFTIRLDPYSQKDIVQRFAPDHLTPYDHRFIPLPPAELRINAEEFEHLIRRRLSTGQRSEMAK